MDELEICAESEDKANEIAQNILEGDARTHLDHGCFIADFETDLIEEDVDEEETEVQALKLRIGYNDHVPHCEAFAYRNNEEWYWSLDDSEVKVEITAWKKNCEPYKTE